MAGVAAVGVDLAAQLVRGMWKTSAKAGMDKPRWCPLAYCLHINMFHSDVEMPARKHPQALHKQELVKL